MWANLAAAQGVSQAVVLRRKVTSQMSAAQIEKAQRLAAAFQPKQENPLVMTPDQGHRELNQASQVN
jgi:hypothetical protein